ncbi:MAG: hypothetical protein ACRDST_03300 [Pseudonocardiaceae bacterium]
MASADEVQLDVRPGLGELSRRHRWSTEVEATVHQDAGDTSEPTGLAEQDAVLPGTPVAGGLFTNPGIGVVEQG